MKSKSYFDEVQFTDFFKDCVVIIAKKYLPKPRSQRFSSRSFILFSFTFKSVDYFGLIFVWYEVSIYVLCFVCIVYWCSVIPEPFFKRPSFSPLNYLGTFVKINHKYMSLLLDSLLSYRSICLSLSPTILNTVAL